MNKISKFIIHPIFLLFACIMIYFGDGFVFASYLLAVLIHEFGHSFVAKKLGYKLKSLCLMPYGAQLNLQSNALRCKDEVIIALAGPIANIIAGALCVALWWVFPLVYAYTEWFVVACLVTAIFNLLPLVPLDGSRVLLAILGNYNKRKIGYKIISIFNCLVSGWLFLVFLCSCFFEVNFNLGIIAILLFMGAFEKNTEFDYCYLFQIEKFELNKKRSLPVKFFAVHTDFKVKDLIKLTSPNFYAVVVVLDDEFKPIKTIYESEFQHLLVGRLCD